MQTRTQTSATLLSSFFLVGLFFFHNSTRPYSQSFIGIMARQIPSTGLSRRQGGWRIAQGGTGFECRWRCRGFGQEQDIFFHGSFGNFGFTDIAVTSTH